MLVMLVLGEHQCYPSRIYYRLNITLMSLALRMLFLNNTCLEIKQTRSQICINNADVVITEYCISSDLT